MAQLSERIPGVSVYLQANLDVVREVAGTYDIISALARAFSQLPASLSLISDVRSQIWSATSRIS